VLWIVYLDHFAIDMTSDQSIRMQCDARAIDVAPFDPVGNVPRRQARVVAVHLDCWLHSLR